MAIAIVAMSNSSHLMWVETTQKLGEVKINELKELKFVFMNKGYESVKILEAVGSCSCTVVEFPNEEISPGSRATIKAKFRSSTPGSFRKSIKIKTSDSENYTYLHFSGIVKE